ncbi:hypothetical protein DRE_01305 [Drechslerella stenobrocha 248]|uniref:Uncharacterized protein n=1 Tax=Drechslerella stenobrocha 248 TaxID=1043628 RepID=W7HVP8_9PEZI|nr:hypothetical protein DRE_01305 [Drechslerella stenobrocha 248]
MTDHIDTSKVSPASSRKLPVVSPPSGRLLDKSLDADFYPDHFQGTSRRGRRSHSKHSDRKRHSSSTPELNLSPSNVKPFLETRPDVLLNAPSNLQSALRSAATEIIQPSMSKRNRRVSFSSHDQVLLCSLNDDKPLTEAQRSWKVCRRTSLASYEKSKERVEEGEIEKPSAYPPDANRDLRSTMISMARVTSPGQCGPVPEQRGRHERARRLSLGHPRRTASRQQRQQRHELEGGGTQDMKHRHRHGFASCEHGFLDPMDCTCEEPRKTIHATRECKECSKARTLLALNRDASEEEKEDYTSWWKKLGRKIAS